MFGFCVTLFSTTASFREPSAHLYQSTLPFPPVSAMVGLAGAALGKNFAQTWCYLKEKRLAVGVYGDEKGRGIDLWKYNKIAIPKSNDEKKASKSLKRNKIVRNDILNREFIVYPTFNICYASPDKEFVLELFNAFANPFFALSLGSSDDIAMVKKVSKFYCLSEQEKTVLLKNTLIEGDHSNDIRFDWEAIKKTSVSRPLKPPMVRQVIVDFEFKGLERKGVSYRPFTFLADDQILKSKVKVFLFEEIYVPMYSIGETAK